MRLNSSFLSIVLFLVLGSALTGCAFGNRHTYRDVQYRDVQFTVPETKGIEIALATHDTDLKKQATGLQRGGYGNPFDVLNSKGEALSTSFTYAICHSIQRSGGKCVEVQTGPGEPNIEVQRRLAETRLPHGVLLTLSEWKTDTYQNTSLQYAVTVEIFNSKGESVMMKRFSGRDDLRGSFFNPPSHARKAAPVAFQRKMSEILSDPEIVGVLRGDGGQKVVS